MVTIKGGCVLINTTRKEVAIIYRPHKNDYSFPKGHVEEGETVKEGAIRECIEETGKDIELLRDDIIYTQKYTTPLGEDVEVQFYLANEIGEYQGEIKEEDKEICKWIPFDEVSNILSYESNQKMWNSIKDIVAEEFAC